MLMAYDAKTGKELWSFDVGLGISAPPITYSINGRQYISILVGFGGGFAGLGGASAAALGWAYGVHTRRVITLSIEGKASLPPQPAKSFPKPVIDTEFKVEDSLVAKGGMLFGYCGVCHGGGVMAPNLEASPVPLVADAFAAVVQKGGRVDKGMPSFPNLSDQDLLSIRHYIRQVANNSVQAKEVSAR